MPSGAVLEGQGPPLRPRALACLVSRDSELAYLLRSLIKLSPPPPSREQRARAGRQFMSKTCGCSTFEADFDVFFRVGV